jgi:hypothetical protein
LKTKDSAVLRFVEAESSFILNPDPLVFGEADFVGAAVVQFRRAGRGMVCHRLRVFQGAGAFQIIGDAGCTPAVVADFGFVAGRAGVTLDHAVSVRLPHAARLAGCPPVVPIAPRGSPSMVSRVKMAAPANRNTPAASRKSIIYG